MPQLIHNLSLPELQAALQSLGEPPFRAGQIWRWLYVQRVAGWDGMHNVPQELRDTLAGQFDLIPGTVEDKQEAPDGTCKLLVKLRDGETVEQVLIPSGERRTVCVSSQVGCRFNCAFCASGQAGFKRDLEPGEIVQQVLLAAQLLGGCPNNVVYMGMGEPFDNYDAVLKSVRILNDHDGLNIGARHITISTAGVVPGIRRLAEEQLQVELSVSLHAADDDDRDRLMPINKRWPLPDLVEACVDYFNETNRIITFEYTLIAGVNDTEADATAVGWLLCVFPTRVNLIPLSPVDEYDGRPTSRSAAQRFLDILDERGIDATLRASKGAAIRAACGQLRAAGRP